MHRIACLLAFVLLTLAVTVQPVLSLSSEKRVALVIGNGAYKTAPQLKNPTNDAQDMAQALKRLGFEVMLLTDATHQRMEKAVVEFGVRLRQGGVGLFYYAGHGTQVKGQNYLIPVDAAIQSEGEVKFKALDAGLVISQMEEAGNGMNIVILDACRTNPYTRSFRSSVQGLARLDAPVGTLIAFSTAPDTAASDGTGRNSVYTQYLLNSLLISGLKIEDVFKTVRAAVVRETDKQQVPWESSSLIGQFYFSPPDGVTQTKETTRPNVLAFEKQHLPEQSTQDPGKSVSKEPVPAAGQIDIGLTLRPALRSKLGQFFHADANYGIEVVDVAPGSLCAQADIIPGDVVLQVNQRRTTTVEQFNYAMRTDARQKGVAMLVLKRNGANIIRAIRLQ
jgi:hypothetical protein